ncbi:MAG TPA: hypothetical protein VF665_07310 [Longimicrobium sp.]|jgi:hypothetical protein|uniref:hypothetical protein n=1 Tax=Longimicrobium sp. TaxID=2029185 RepID=UPI002ED7C570
MSISRARLAVSSVVLLAFGIFAPTGATLLRAQTTKCYFKDCVVYEDGTRLCQVREIACPAQQ